MIVAILRIVLIIGIILGMGWLMKEADFLGSIVILIFGGIPILVLLDYDF